MDQDLRFLERKALAAGRGTSEDAAYILALSRVGRIIHNELILSSTALFDRSAQMALGVELTPFEQGSQTKEYQAPQFRGRRHGRFQQHVRQYRPFYPWEYHLEHRIISQISLLVGVQWMLTLLKQMLIQITKLRNGRGGLLFKLHPHPQAMEDLPDIIALIRYLDSWIGEWVSRHEISPTCPPIFEQQAPAREHTLLDNIREMCQPRVPIGRREQISDGMAEGFCYLLQMIMIENRERLLLIEIPDDDFDSSFIPRTWQWNLMQCLDTIESLYVELITPIIAKMENRKISKKQATVHFQANVLQTLADILLKRDWYQPIA